MGRRTAVLLGAVALGGAGLWFGWPWLVVAGIAPIIVALAPCLIMCGAMCAMKMCSKKPSGAAGSDTNPTVTARTGSEQSASAQPEFGPGSIPGTAAGTRTPA